MKKETVIEVKTTSQVFYCEAMEGDILSGAFEKALTSNGMLTQVFAKNLGNLTVEGEILSVKEINKEPWMSATEEAAQAHLSEIKTEQKAYEENFIKNGMKAFFA